MSLGLLKEIHREIFDNFIYQTDIAQYKVEEKWVMLPEHYKPVNKVIGDCEDFALAIRKVCRDNGIQDTRLVACLTEDGEGHLVLEWHGWIADNRQKQIVKRDDLDYTWNAISGYNPGDQWYRIRT